MGRRNLVPVEVIGKPLKTGTMHQMIDGQIRRLGRKMYSRGRPYYLYKSACCDCGLVHEYILHVPKGRPVELMAWRDNVATANRRRAFHKAMYRRHHKRKPNGS